jgi:hypothetical protein
MKEEEVRSQGSEVRRRKDEESVEVSKYKKVGKQASRKGKSKTTALRNLGTFLYSEKNRDGSNFH